LGTRREHFSKAIPDLIVRQVDVTACYALDLMARADFANLERQAGSGPPGTKIPKLKIFDLSVLDGLAEGMAQRGFKE
jgi:hypothetical protein